MISLHATTVYLLRHGETDWGQDHNRYCGRTDIPLNETGRDQAKRVAQTLQSLPFTAVYSSPLDRAMSTARPIAEMLKLDVTASEDLMEIDFGGWEGMRRSDIVRLDPEHWAKWLNSPSEVRAGHTGETAASVVNRASTFVSWLHHQHPGGVVLVVAHNTLNRLLIASSLGMELSRYRALTQSNCGISIAEISGEAARWVSINETSHLRA